MTRRLTLSAAALGVVLALAGCDATRLVEGDSITWQFDQAGGGAELADVEVHAGPGWQIDQCVDHASPGCVSPAENLAARADGLDRVVILLGTNDADEVWNGGWTADDETRWAAVLDATPADLDVVLVLPWLSDAARPAHRTQIDAARAWMSRQAGERANIAVVDWRPYAERPGVLAPDGVHLAHADGDPAALTLAAYDARRDVITDALDLDL